MQIVRFVFAAFQIVAMSLALFGIVYGPALSALVMVQVCVMCLQIRFRERKNV